MKKINFKEKRTAYKITFVTAALALIINVVVFVVFIVPIYDFVGNTQLSDSEMDTKLDRAETVGNITVNLTLALIVVASVSGGYGAYKEIENKDKKKKTAKSVDIDKSNNKKTVKKKK